MKFIYIFFIIILILCVFSNLNNKSKYLDKSLAIVGNGPLTNKEIDEINKYDIIAIINNNRNGKNKSIKATHHFLRQDGIDNRGFHGWDKNENKFLINLETNKTIKNIILLCPEGKECIENINSIKEKYINKNINVISSGSEPWKESIFIFNKKKYKHSNSPSSGILTIKYMLENFSLHTIHIYGMNSIRTDYHDMKKEKEYIDECDRCIMHKTWKNTHES